MGGRRQLKRVCKMRCFLIILSLVSALHAQRSSPPEGQRCSGRNFNGRRCCTPDKPCGLGEGDCDGPLDGGANDGHAGCQGDLVCGSNNCFQEQLWNLQQVNGVRDVTMSPVGDVAHLRTLVARERVTVTEQEMEVSMMETEDVDQVLFAAAITAESLVPIITRKMTAARGPVVLQVKHQLYSLVGQTGVRGALEPPAGQRCKGRNYEPGRRCCTPENPCGEGEGDCDGAGDGGVNDGDRGCRPGLVCGSNNCRKFGAYYHEKDDCCERASGATGQTPAVQSGGSDWGPWSEWTGCSRSGIRTREQRCRGETCSLGNGRVGSVNTQERYCYTKK